MLLNLALRDMVHRKAPNSRDHPCTRNAPYCIHLPAEIIVLEHVYTLPSQADGDEMSCLFLLPRCGCGYTLSGSVCGRRFEPPVKAVLRYKAVI